MSTTTPPWPSLYNPGLEVLNIQHSDPVQHGAYYLYHANDVFRFTFFWTLIFYVPLFLVCGSYAFFNYAFPPSLKKPASRQDRESYHLSAMTSQTRASTRFANHPTKTTKPNERRSRVAFALIILSTFLILSVIGAVIASAILGYIMAGVYKAANFNMSTWIPFLLAVIQVLIGLLSIWPSIIDIM